MPQPARRYRAFISYSQVDTRPAQRLHRALENYRVPLGIAPDAVRKGRRLGRFFRDMDEMGAATDISATVRGAIDDSDSLIVVCSPRSAKSIWVEAEIQHFRKTGRGESIYAVIIDGVPNSGNPETECFPAGLRVAYRDDGMPIEPVGIDLRKESLNRACNRIAAGLLGVPFDALWRRSRREFHRRVMLVGGAAAGVAAVAASIMVMIWSGQARETGRTRSAQLAEAARGASDAGLFDRAARFAVAALQGADDWLTGYPARDAELELRRALGGGLDWIVQTDAKPPVSVFDEPTWTAAAFSPDGKRIFVGGAEGRAELRNAETGELVAAMSGHAGAVGGVFSPDGARLVTSGEKGAGVLREAATGAVVAQLEAPDGGNLDSPVFSADGALLATNSTFQTVYVWDGRTGVQIAALEHPQTVFGVWMVPDGSELLTLSSDDMMRRWNPRTGQVIAEWRIDRRNRLAVSLDGTRIAATGQSDKSLKIFDRNGKRLRTVTTKDMPQSLAFSADGAWLAVGGMEGIVEVLDVKGKDDGIVLPAHGTAIERIGFSPDGVHILTETRTEAAAIWTWKGRPSWVASLGAGLATDRAVFSPDGRRALAATRDGALSMTALADEPPMQLATGAASISPPAISADGKVVAIAMKEGDVQLTLWSLVDGKQVGAIKGEPGAVTRMALSPDGAQLMVMTDSDGAYVWDVASGALVARGGGEGSQYISGAWGAKGPRAVLFDQDGPAIHDLVKGGATRPLATSVGAASDGVMTQDGALIATHIVGTDGMEDETAMQRATVIVISDVETAKELRRLEGHTREISDMAFSPDGKTLASWAQDQTLRIWDVASGAQKRMRERVPFPTMPPVFSPDGKRVAVASQDLTISLLDIADGSVRQLTGHYNTIYTMEFSKDGRYLATGAEDSTARVWDVASGRELAQVRGEGIVWTASFTSDGRLLVMDESDVARVHKLPSALSAPRGDLIQRVCSHMLMGKASRFSADELKGVPLLDATRDADACRR